MTQRTPNKTLMDSGIANWKADMLPDLTGKLYVITGGNSGIGFEAAKHLGNAGADIVLACRSVAKAEEAAKELRSLITGQVDVVQLDLGDLVSVRAAAEAIRASIPRSTD